MAAMKPSLRTPRRWAPLFPAAAYYGAIFFLSSRSRFPSALSSFPLSDKFIHGLIFAGFALVLLWGLRRVLPPNAAAAWIATAAIGLLGGILDEVHQIFVPLRRADPADVLADVIGIVAALVVAVWICRRRLRRTAVKGD